MTAFALLDPASDALLRTLDLARLEALSLSLLDISVLAHLPASAISPVDAWHPEDRLPLVQSERLNLSTRVSARQRLAQENRPVVDEDKLESELTEEDRAILTQVSHTLVPAENGQYRVLFAAPAALDAPTGMTTEEQDLSAQLDLFESFVLQGQQQQALLRNLSIELPGAAPAPVLTQE